jgi:hypothetical protein
MLTSILLKRSSTLPTAAQQIMGREGETATFLLTGLLNPKLRGGGFAPRQILCWKSSYFHRPIWVKWFSSL